MPDKIKNDMKKIFKGLIIIVAICILAEIIVYKVIIADRVDIPKYHNRIMHEEIIATCDQLLDKKAVQSGIDSSNYLKVDRISVVDGNTVIDAVFINKTGVNIDGIEFIVVAKNLTAKGKKLRDTGGVFSAGDFENNDICTGYTGLDVDGIDTTVEAGKTKQIRMVIHRHRISKNELYKIRGISKYLN